MSTTTPAHAELAPTALYEISPGPWQCEPCPSSPSGAVLILDADGEIIGWATDAAGHTSEICEPDRRHRDDITRNARVLSAAPTMLSLCLMVTAHSYRVRHEEPEPIGGWTEGPVEQLARQILRQVGP